jgi:hypothetical protein
VPPHHVRDGGQIGRAAGRLGDRHGKLAEVIGLRTPGVTIASDVVSTPLPSSIGEAHFLQSTAAR